MRILLIRVMILSFFIALGCRPEPTQNAKIESIGKTQLNNLAVEMPDSVKVYLLAALDTMRMYSVKRDRIHWAKLKKETFQLAKGALTYAQTYDAIREAVKALGDNHSFFKTPNQHAQWADTVNVDHSKLNAPFGRFTKERYAVLPIGTYSSGNTARGITYAIELQKTIKELDKKNPVAWIIDVRYNRGGNMWPVLAGLGPLFESEGTLGSLVSSDNKKASWRYSNGRALLDNKVQILISNPYMLKNKNLPIAIFTSGNTSSSAEAIVVSFKGRPHTRVFGTPTAGLSTANRDHTLMDGAQLILTSAILADRAGKKYGGKLLPDEDLSNKWYYLLWFQFVTLKAFVNDWLDNIPETTNVQPSTKAPLCQTHVSCSALVICFKF